jgi:endonuclease/exonuclease/phosphatase family metal-dependent hydrolase
VPVFPKPGFPFVYDVATETARLRAHKTTRLIPAKAPGTLLVATWNVANFGAQDRRDQDHRVIAEIMGWFDLVAVQEVRDNFAGLDDVRRNMGGSFQLIFSDTAGNNERMAFVYDSSKLSVLEEVGEISIPPSQERLVKLSGVRQKFEGFDRNPYLVAFRVGAANSFTFVNVHLFFGSDKPAEMGRRALEAFAVARWADQRRKSPFSFTRELVALGDFNMPKREPGDPVFEALRSKGLELPTHSSELGSSLVDDKHYDQVAFFPGPTRDAFTGQLGVFDYDAVIFKELWETRGKKDFNAYCRYYISDHRPLWFQLGV